MSKTFTVHRLSHRFARKGKRTVLAAALLAVFLFLLTVAAFARFSPLIVELALADATDVITLTVNEVISEKVMDERVDYRDLVTLEKDEEGNITALVTNMAEINYLRAEITHAVVERFGKDGLTEVSIPLGSLLGGALFSGRGPVIRANILSVTNVNTTFRNEFSSAGINQTRHRIIMDVDVTLGILLAGYTDRWDNVMTEITVAETVIVGSVPDTYASLS